MLGSKKDLYLASILELLSDVEKQRFNCLIDKLRNNKKEYKKQRKIEMFMNSLDEIRIYCEKNEEDDWIRYLASGICWIGNDIFLNTLRFRNLVSKSKSTINSYFAKLNYDPIAINHENSQPLVEAIPYLKTHYDELRQWTLRKPHNNLMDFPSSPEDFGISGNSVSNLRSRASAPQINNDSCLFDFQNDTEKEKEKENQESDDIFGDIQFEFFFDLDDDESQI